jgi:hypothetical protein
VKFGNPRLDEFSAPLEELRDSIVREFRFDVEAIVVLGSLVVGDFIPGYSDIDVQAYLTPNACYPHDFNFLRKAINLHSTATSIEERYHLISPLQISLLDTDYVNSRTKRGEWVSLDILKHVFVLRRRRFKVERLYRVADLIEARRRSIAELPQITNEIVRTYLNIRKSAEDVSLRIAGFYLKNASRDLLTVVERDPGNIQLRFRKLANKVDDLIGGPSRVSSFVEQIEGWNELIQSGDRIKQALLASVDCLDAIYEYSKRQSMLPSVSQHSS